MKKRVTHGMTGTPTYISWLCMKRRCDSPKAINYADYGQRGISYDPRWREFPNFLADVGPRPEGTSLDRVDNSKGYSKENVGWADRKTQAQNRRPRQKKVIPINSTKTPTTQKRKKAA
jgi:hypothetical protein